MSSAVSSARETCWLLCSQEPQQQSSWQEGFGLQDFEDFATVRRGPGILRPGEGEEDFFRPADNLTGGAGGAGTTGDAGASFGSERPGSEAFRVCSDFVFGRYSQDPQVDKDANDETIKRSYKKLALKYHPDKNRGSEIAQKRFQAIAAAYETLRDPEKRRAYDKAAAKKESAIQCNSRSKARTDHHSQSGSQKFLLSKLGRCFEAFLETDQQLSLRLPSQQLGGKLRIHLTSQHRTGKTQIRKLSKEEYNNLLSELKEAEETAKMWHEEVEAAREQLQEAEATRDRYLRILQECYDRTSRR
eukprot:g2200.t1